nr:catalase [uncultured bacterium]
MTRLESTTPPPLPRSANHTRAKRGEGNAAATHATAPRSDIEDGYVDPRYPDVRPSKDWTRAQKFRDGSPQAEAIRHQKWANEHAAIQRKVGEKVGKIMRGQHAEPIGDVKVKLEVLPDIPAFARHGIFKPGATYEGYGRFSNAPGAPQPLRVATSRGLAVSLTGPHGTQQDFLAVTLNGFFRDPADVMAVVRAQAVASRLPRKLRPATTVAIASLMMGPKRAAETLGNLRKMIAREPKSLATETYFSNMPIRVGPYAAKYAWLPMKAAEAPKGELDADLKARLESSDTVFELQLQFYENESTTPLEDMRLPWKVPFVPVARLTIPKQELDSAEGQARQADIEGGSFTPWHTAEHEPVGEVGRARKAIYATSAKTRGACPFKGLV